MYTLLGLSAPSSLLLPLYPPPLLFPRCRYYPTLRHLRPPFLHLILFLPTLTNAVYQYRIVLVASLLSSSSSFSLVHTYLSPPFCSGLSSSSRPSSLAIPLRRSVTSYLYPLTLLRSPPTLLFFFPILVPRSRPSESSTLSLLSSSGASGFGSLWLVLM